MSRLIAPVHWKAILIPGSQIKENFSITDLPIVQFSKQKLSNLYIKCPDGFSPQKVLLTKATKIWRACHRSSKYSLKGLVTVDLRYSGGIQTQLLKLIEDYSIFTWSLHLLAYKHSFSQIDVKINTANDTFPIVCDDFMHGNGYLCPYRNALIGNAQHFHLPLVSVI